MMEAYPSILPVPLQDGYGRDTEDGLRSTEPAAGPLIYERKTFDRPSEFSLRFQFSKGQARIFWLWYREQLDDGMKPFGMDLLIESGMETQECRFMPGGHPQLTGVDANEFSYTATVQVRDVESRDSGEYETLVEMAAISPNSDPEAGMKLVDIAVNEGWPSA